ncbi:MAG: YwiC-like family protein, partial [Actinomycetales bacterium]|nr:YwiC-like family protein [Actinomycetales bacterium]
MPDLSLAAPDPRRAAPPRRRRRGPGWVPNQHGAWAMLIVPFAVGALEG